MLLQQTVYYAKKNYSEKFISYIVCYTFLYFSHLLHKYVKICLFDNGIEFFVKLIIAHLVLSDICKHWASNVFVAVCECTACKDNKLYSFYINIYN